MNGFLPISKQDMVDRGWYYCDFLLVTGDAYIDHPSFGTAIISRVLEDAGFRVAILSQPDFTSEADFLAMGRPRYAVLVNAGNIDSMVAHYTAAKKRRHDDAYTPGGMGGKRPDRAATVYAMLARRAFPDTPVILGGIEASLRRFAHYDYWSDQIMPSILSSSGADALMYGMGEHSVVELARAFKAGKKGNDLWRTIRGMGYFAHPGEDIPFPAVECPSYEDVLADKAAYARSVMLQYEQADHVRGKAVLQHHGKRIFVQNPPALPLTTAEMDKVYGLPYMRTYHPSYEALGGVPAIQEVQFSIIHNRGCFGACNFCALAFHQGRYIQARSHESVVHEAEQIAKHPDFKGYIHDVGGPTANFRFPSCKQQEKHGLCAKKRCLFPEACGNLEADHRDYLSLLRKLRQVEGVKKVFVRSGLRYDYMMADNNDEFFLELIKYHISGQLKVAPEHMSDHALYYMGKPSFSIYEKFRERYTRINEKLGKKQYLVPYLMSSHPGATLDDAILLAEYLNRVGYMPEQVQDFYPTPGTLSTAMYYSGLDPRTMKPVYVAKTAEEKAMQRALLQWRRPDKRPIVLAALKKAGREDLIGFGKECLIRPARGQSAPSTGRKNAPHRDGKAAGSADAGRYKPMARKKGWAKPKKKK
ncbi:YgiQ family radical SAM protein [Intestinibacillus sp. Marseille-P6563]|uniref:YgiQ family radical SAM protein n=1 Tax=Intestinibacillus sp. Marseille-P6563 TaxID=2364792 RepID=UPI000F05BD0B|nr:YgiQ family radical SAM protein [Intestinibacillus sp. Marseille-P6563]